MAPLQASGLRALSQSIVRAPQAPAVPGPRVEPRPLHSGIEFVDSVDLECLRIQKQTLAARPQGEGRVRRWLHGKGSGSPDPAKLSPWAKVKGKFKNPTPDTWWYKAKVAFLAVACNLDLPFLRRKPFEHGAPAEATRDLKPGDILLRRTDWTSGNLFIPSWWKHAAVYTGHDQIVEAAFKGLRPVSVDEFFEHGDDVMILRMKDLSWEQRVAVANYARAQVGKPYDFSMDFVDETRMSCTELAYQSLQAATGRDPVGMGTFGEVTGDRFMNPNFDLIWTSNPEASGVQP